MEPVINPWLFYLIDCASGLKWGILVFGGSVGLILLGIGAVTMSETNTSKEEKAAQKKIKKGYIIFTISVVLFLAIPSSETVMKMVIAQNVTYDAVDVAKDVVVQVYNDILALFQK